MKVSFVRPELRHLDEVAGEAIALGVFADERPLRGAAGFVDWRLNGALSRCMMADRFRAEPGEALLYPDRGRLSFGRVLLWGLGARPEFDESRWRAACVGILRALRGMEVSRFAAPVPGRAALPLNSRHAMEHWLAAIRDVYLDDPEAPRVPEVLVIEDPETQRVIADTTHAFLRRLARERA